MGTVEGRILGSDPKATASARLASTREDRKNRWPLENPRMGIAEAYPRVFSHLESVRFNPFDGSLLLATYVPDRKDPEKTMKRWSTFGGLEELTGFSAEMVLRNDPTNGKLVEGTRNLIDLTRQKGELFRSQVVPESDLAQYLDEATEILKQSGFEKPILGLKKRIRDQIKAGLGKDSIYRRNPLIARTRLVSAMVKLLMVEQLQDMVAKKYLELFTHLLPEFQLEQALTQQLLDELKDDDSDLALLRTMGDDISSPIKCAPFRRAAMQAYLGIFSNGRRSIDARFFTDYPDLRHQIETLQISDYKPELIANLEQALADGSNIYDQPSV